MRPEDAEPLAITGGSPRGVGTGPFGVVVFGRARAAAGMAESGFDVRVADLGEAGADGTAGIQRRDALLGVAPVATEMLGGKPFEQGAFAGVDRPLSGQDLGDRPRLVAGPGAKGENQHVLVDQPVLQGEQTNEQVAVRGVAVVHERSPTHTVLVLVRPGTSNERSGPVTSQSQVKTASYHRTRADRRSWPFGVRAVSRVPSFSSVSVHFIE